MVLELKPRTSDFCGPPAALADGAELRRELLLYAIVG